MALDSASQHRGGASTRCNPRPTSPPTYPGAGSLFSDADRGRYADRCIDLPADASGCAGAALTDDVTNAIDIARDLKVPVLARGGGTSQCGQTTGVALVIDNSKYLRNVLAFDAEARTVMVEPGMVLDHLNAQPQAPRALVPRWTYRPAHRPHWAAWRATIPAAHAPSPTATWCTTCWVSTPGWRMVALRRLARKRCDRTCQQLGRWRLPRCETSCGDERVWPKVMRRVAGYNLDIFCNQSERPYTADGSVNLAHLLVGSEGTLAFTQSLTLALSPCRKRRCWAW